MKLTRLVLSVVAAALVVAATTLEGALGLHESRARSELARSGTFTARAIRESEAAPSAASLRLSALARAAEGDFEGSARDAALARRIDPNDDDAARTAETAVDAALLARLRPLSRGLGFAGAAGLVLLFLGSARRCRDRMQRDRWLDSVRGRVSVAETSDAAAVDVFLDPRAERRPERPPAGGATLAVVLTQLEEGVSIRLTPRSGVRESAARVRIEGSTLARVRSLPGRWRVHARLDGRTVAQGDWVVASGARNAFAVA